MQKKKRITRFFIGRIMNRDFIRNGTMAHLEYAPSNFVKRYPCFHRATQNMCIACHMIIISQNFAECKQYLKKKINSNFSREPLQTNTVGLHYKYKREQGGLPPCLFPDSLLYIYPCKSPVCGKKLKMKKNN
jgi:hypothetical protein